MEQHKASKKSGNNAAKAGNEEQNKIRDNRNSENIAEADKRISRIMSVKVIAKTRVIQTTKK